MDTGGILALVLAIMLIAGCLGYVLYSILRSPFKYPYFYYNFDVTGKRKPQFTELIDEYLIENHLSDIEIHQQMIEDWKEKSKEIIDSSRIPNYRRTQYENAIDDEAAYRFIMYRTQTRYVQSNYVKTPYKVDQAINVLHCSFEKLQERDKKLQLINYESSLQKYHCTNQRKLMTRELRTQIMERDNYTCQFCGKYMPDGVGLQIDHIVPVSKGGKTIPSNLQVLCSKCNGKKHDKMD